MVSSFKDYLSCRPTEISEEDVLLCESRYIEAEKQMKKFKGLKRFSYSSKVVEDEIFYFRLVSQGRILILIQSYRIFLKCDYEGFFMCSLVLVSYVGN